MLTIDTREQNSINPVKTYFEKKEVDVTVEMMRYGDYRLDVTTESGINKVIIIERKTPADFINSTNATVKEPATKIARQLNGCMDVDGADKVILLIDGLYYPLKGGKIKAGKVRLRRSPDSMFSQLRTIMEHGIRVEHNPADWYLPQFLYSLHQYESKDEHNTLSLAPKSFSIPSKEKAKWTVLMGIKGVGPIMAAALIDHFGSVQAIANADLEVLMEVKGVGRKTAEELLWYMR